MAAAIQRRMAISRGRMHSPQPRSIGTGSVLLVAAGLAQL